MGTANQVAILAGGLGKRLRALLGDLPKPMIPIAGRPLLEHHIELAKHHGFTRIAIFACYKAEVIQNHFGDGSKWGVELDYIIEREPLGTAGAVLDRLDAMSDRFLVMYGDTMLNVDLGRLWRTHEESKAAATLLLHPNNHPLDSDLVEMDAQDRITAFHNRPHDPDRYFQNLVNAGLYVLEKRALERWRDKAGSREQGGNIQHTTFNVQHPMGEGGADSGGRRGENIQPSTSNIQRPMREGGAEGGGRIGAVMLDFGKDVFPELVASGARLHGYNSPEFIKDIGTPDRYHWVCAQHEAGIIQRSSFETPQPAVFLDRDGTLIEEVTQHGISSHEQLRLIPGAAEAVHALNQSGLRVVVVTNQPVVAKGMATEADIQKQHNKLETLLGHEHAFVDRIYWCPHHPEKGFPGERADLKIECDCRKPKTGMIQRAAGELNLDLSKSWLVGDTTTDVQTAKNAGLRSILVRTGHGGKDGRHSVSPDVQTDDLLGAAKHILQEANRKQVQE